LEDQNHLLLVLLHTLAKAQLKTMTWIFSKRRPQTKTGRDTISGLKHKQNRANHVTDLWPCPITNHLSILFVFTLKFDTCITDNILNYVVKSLKDKLGLTDAPVAFFSSFFFTKLCLHGHEDPALKNKYSYEEVAGWTGKTF
jgi:hypothetical protein